MGIISYLADFFQRLPATERPGYLLLLPTKNLIEQFQYRLARACGTTLLPYSYTLSTFTQDYGQVYAKSISNAARQAVMHQAVNSKKFTHFTGGSETVLFSLWEDLVLAGRISSAADLSSGKFLKDILARLEPTLNRSSTYRQFMEEYLDEFSTIFRIYLDLLAGMELEDPLLVSRRQINKTLKQLPGLADRFRILVADLYDAPPIQLGLLEALAGTGARFLFSGYHFSEPRRWPKLIKNLPPEQVTWCSPPAKELLRRAVDPNAHKRSPLPEAETVTARIFPSVAAECRYVIHQALALVCGGLPAEEIAIVVTDQHHYREILYSLIHALPADRLPIDIFSFNLKRPVGRSSLAVFIETLLRLAGSVPLSTQLLFEAIESPFFSPFFLDSPEADNPEKEQREMESLLRQALADQVVTAVETLEVMASRTDNPLLERGIKALTAAAAHFPAKASLADYLDLVAGLIEQSRELVNDLYENAVRDHLAAVIAEIRQLELDISFRLPSFHTFFQTAVAGGETGLNYDYLSGIQILDPRDAKGIAAGALFFTGNSSGSFLGRGRGNSCFTPGQQQRLGLITPQRQEILQRFTVYSLINNCERVWITRALEIEGKSQEGNIFFKELVWAGMEPVMPTVDISWSGRETEQAVVRGEEAAGNLLPIRELPPRLSGRQATCLLQCPARYFFEALGLQAPSIREERLDPLGEGAVLHRVMETLGKKLPEPKSKAEILAAIDEICRRLEATWEERLLFSLLEHSGCWERLADFLLEGGRKSLAVEEWVEADLEPVAGLPIRGVGKIDRRDRGPAGERLVDYKRNKIPSKKAINSFDDVQLLFYALLKELNDEKIDAIAYYSLRRRQQNCSEAEVEPLLPVFRELLAQQLTGIAEAGGYRKIINGHCDSCPYREICLDESQLRTANGQA